MHPKYSLQGGVSLKDTGVPDFVLKCFVGLRGLSLEFNQNKVAFKGS